MPSLSPESSSPEVLLRCGHTSYQFVQLLGPARHGELVLVRRAFEQRFGGYTVLKRPLPAASEEARRRLVDEARVIAQLHHPNLPVILQYKWMEDGPHLLLQYVPGLRLRELLVASAKAQQPLSEPLACFVASEVADALHHAHTLSDENGRELGLVHRDVTPHNILLGDQGEVMLLDFASAWSRLAGRVSSEGLALQGSLAYASPEHVQQTALDGRTDQFALGIVLLQMLTGRHLFEGAERFDARQRQPHPPEDSTTHMCAHELAWLIRNYSVEDLAAATRSVPVALLPIVQRALSPDRIERFDSCASLARALREHLRSLGGHFGRQDAVTELAALRYVALRVAAGEAPEEAVRERMLPEYGPRSFHRVSGRRLSARLRRTPRRR
jgi:serine/threonine protein kinase